MGKHLLIACAVGDLQWLQLCVNKGADPTFVNNEVLLCCSNRYSTFIFFFLSFD